jgi:hypothetical protein
MARVRPVTRALGLALVIGIIGVPTARASATTVLHLDGIGPLRLGMPRAAAVATGWLADRGAGCELASPRPITYRFTGRRAPAGVRGVAQFDGDVLTALSFTRGVRTATGIRVGHTASSRMVTRYRAAGFRASAMFEPIFAGTFVTVRRRNGRQVLGAFAKRRRITEIAIPAIPVCE